jgi:hypothetical protein
VVNGRLYVTDETAHLLAYEPSSYVLTVATSGSGAGSVTSDPTGIDCGAACAAPFAVGTVVTLTASPSGSSTFLGWSGNGCSGTGTCQVLMTQAQSVTATFTIGCLPLTLSNQTVTTTQSYASCGTLTVGPAFRVAAPGDVTCRAALRVVLTNGFSIGPGATFTAGLDLSLAGP